MVGPSVQDPRNGVEWDLPPCPSARAYVLASTPRTGSTLLARLLWDHGGVGAPKEYLNPMQLRDWEVRLGGPLSRATHGLLKGPLCNLAGHGIWTARRRRDHLERVRQRRASGGWFGLKLHWHHHEQWCGEQSLEAMLGPVRWIRVRREDRLAQAVSWEVALQTGRWVRDQFAWRLPHYDRDRITQRLAEIEAHEAGWAGRLRGEQVHEVVYEALLADRDRVLAGVLDHLGVAFRESPVPDVHPMGSPVQVDWINRYRRGG